MSNKFKALVLEDGEAGIEGRIDELSVSDLPDGDVLVRVEYSNLNYKDGMILTGTGGLVRNYPHVPGIDFAGIVEASTHERYSVGDNVALTGWRVGETHWGGFAQSARVNGDWLVPIPDSLSTKQAMAVGTAGFTSMLSIMALEDHGLTPETGSILVTGSAGGVGSIAVAILSHLGYSVAASTGRASLSGYLTSLGAKVVVPRDELSQPSKRPLESESWAGAIDTVGSTTLARLLKQVKYGGSVAACGLAAGSELETTVIPFLLRGVNLLGIDSVMQPFENRIRTWDRIARDLPHDKLDEIIQIIGLSGVMDSAPAILSGNVRGRFVVDVAA